MDKWRNPQKMAPKKYKCGYCDNIVASNLGYSGGEPDSDGRKSRNKIYICSNCEAPTYFCFESGGEEQVPGGSYGRRFDLPIPEEVNNLYNEARNCYKINAFTAVGLCSRKLLMHIAVELGDKENKTFVEYVDYFLDNNFMPKNSKEWVDSIRTTGGRINHRKEFLDQKEAEKLLRFLEIIINLIYENDLLMNESIER